MRKYLKEHPWKIIEEGYNPELNKSSESIFSLGNGHMGNRANFEEKFSGPSLQGNYIAGIYYPDKTRVGWWKNGYPEYFAKVLNAPSWIGVNIRINNQILDLAKVKLKDFTRTLNMREGILSREFTAQFEGGEIIKVHTERFVSLHDKEIGTIRYRIDILKGEVECEASLYLDSDVYNEDSNYDEGFWEGQSSCFNDNAAMLKCSTKKTGFMVSMAMLTGTQINDETAAPESSREAGEKKISINYSCKLSEGDSVSYYKYVSVCTSRDYEKDILDGQALEKCRKAFLKGYHKLKDEHIASWDKKWSESDIVIEGDIAAQQGIRFSVFHLNQTYTGHDSRLNIGPKGFTGEKYGGSTYWDTEAYCLPYYLKSSNADIARNLLIYRHKHLGKAIENAEKLGFTNGAALYPMVTMNGEECHNEWEITFEEIHRNGAIAYAIYNYIRHTGDMGYMGEFGLPVLVSIARFWSQRVSFSEAKNLYVILGVTGPNEYENNVNNNWYTNYIAAWCLKYAYDNLRQLKNNDPDDYTALLSNISLTEDEAAKWPLIAESMYLPEDVNLGIFLQQEGYMDKEQVLAADLPEKDKPLNQNWSWDRILRSCFIKQADVLQGLYFFEDHFDLETLKKNFDFYEPRTVHESSLSPSVHVILACKLGMAEKALELYNRSSRLDIDDYNNEVHEGLHITSMAGSCLSVLEGFGGMRIIENQLHFNPILPGAWDSIKFHTRFRGRLLLVETGKDGSHIKLVSGDKIEVYLNGEALVLN